MSNRKVNFVEYTDNSSNDDFKDYIINVLKKLFTNLNLKDLKDLILAVCFIINIIGIKFGFRKRNREHLIKQFKQNNNRDIISIVNIILPYINDKNN